MDGWNTTFLLGRPIFRGYVSFREGRTKLPQKLTYPGENQWLEAAISPIEMVPFLGHVKFSGGYISFTCISCIYVSTGELDFVHVYITK